MCFGGSRLRIHPRPRRCDLSPVEFGRIGFDAQGGRQHQVEGEHLIFASETGWISAVVMSIFKVKACL